MNNSADPFFDESPDIHQDAEALALEVVRRLLVWMAEGETLENRGLRASVALYCLRPDLIKHTTLREIGEIAGMTKQAVHNLTRSFKATTGLGI
jgi:hypothetical protein